MRLEDICLELRLSDWRNCSRLAAIKHKDKANTKERLMRPEEPGSSMAVVSSFPDQQLSTPRPLVLKANKPALGQATVARSSTACNWTHSSQTDQLLPFWAVTLLFPFSKSNHHPLLCRRTGIEEQFHIRHRLTKPESICKLKYITNYMQTKIHDWSRKLVRNVPSLHWLKISWVWDKCHASMRNLLFLAFFGSVWS